MEEKSPMESVQACWKRIRNGSAIYEFLLSDVEIERAEKGCMIAKLKVNARHVNSKGGLHGSTSAAIVDWAGGMAIATHGHEQTGLSVDIHVTYTGIAKEGDVLTIEARTTKVGRNLGFTSISISTEKGVVAQGTHTKYILRDLQKEKA